VLRAGEGRGGISGGVERAGLFGRRTSVAAAADDCIT
jgi:hypothetical protein